MKDIPTPLPNKALKTMRNQTAFLEDNINGRQHQWKTTLMEDDLQGIQRQWKTNSMENKWRINSMEDNLNCK